MTPHHFDFNFFRCGTVSYVSPEVLRGKGYDGKASDMWSVGVITYILLCGYPPFHDEDDSRIMEMTLKGNFSFPDREWGSISANGKFSARSLSVTIVYLISQRFYQEFNCRRFEKAIDGGPSVATSLDSLHE